MTGIDRSAAKQTSSCTDSVMSIAMSRRKRIVRVHYCVVCQENKQDGSAVFPYACHHSLHPICAVCDSEMAKHSVDRCPP